MNNQILIKSLFGYLLTALAVNGTESQLFAQAPGLKPTQNPRIITEGDQGSKIAGDLAWYQINGGQKPGQASSLEVAGVIHYWQSGSYKKALANGGQSLVAREISDLRKGIQALDRFASDPSTYIGKTTQDEIDSARFAYGVLKNVGEVGIGATNELTTLAIGAANPVAGVLYGVYGQKVLTVFSDTVAQLESGKISSIQNSENSWRERGDYWQTYADKKSEFITEMSPKVSNIVMDMTNPWYGDDRLDFFDKNLGTPDMLNFDPRKGFGSFFSAHPDLAGAIYGQQIADNLGKIPRDEKGNLLISPEQISLIKDHVSDQIKNVNKKIDEVKITIDEYLKEEKGRRDSLVENEKKRMIADHKVQTLSASIGIGVFLLEKVVSPKVANQFSAVANASIQAYNAYQKFSTSLANGVLNKEFGSGLKISSSAILTGDLISIGLNLVGAFMDKGPTPDQLILEGIGDLKKQISNLSQQMHDRFNSVDKKLGDIHKELFNNFNSLYAAIGGLDIKIENVLTGMTNLFYEVNALQLSVHQAEVNLGARFSRMSYAACDELKAQDQSTYSLDRINVFNTCLNQIATIFMKDFGSDATGKTRLDGSESFSALTSRIETQPSETDLSLLGVYSVVPTMEFRNAEWDSLAHLNQMARGKAGALNTFEQFWTLSNEATWHKAVKLYLDAVEGNPELIPYIKNESLSTMINQGNGLANFYRNFTDPTIHKDTVKALEEKKNYWTSLVDFVETAYSKYLKHLRLIAIRYHIHRNIGRPDLDLPVESQSLQPLEEYEAGLCEDGQSKTPESMEAWTPTDGIMMRDLTVAEKSLKIKVKPEWLHQALGVTGRVAHKIGLSRFSVCIEKFGFERAPYTADEIGTEVLNFIAGEYEETTYNRRYKNPKIVYTSYAKEVLAGMGSPESILEFVNKNHPPMIQASSEHAPAVSGLMGVTLDRSLPWQIFGRYPHSQKNQIHQAERFWSKNKTFGYTTIDLRIELADQLKEESNGRFATRYFPIKLKSKIRKPQHQSIQAHVLHTFRSFGHHHMVASVPLVSMEQRAEEINSSAVESVELVRSVEEKVDADFLARTNAELKNRKDTIYNEMKSAHFSQNNGELNLDYERMRFANVLLKRMFNLGFSKSMNLDDLNELINGKHAIPSPNDWLLALSSDSNPRTDSFFMNLVRNVNPKKNADPVKNILENAELEQPEGTLTNDQIGKFALLKKYITNYYDDFSKQHLEVPADVEDNLFKLNSLNQLLEHLNDSLSASKYANIRNEAVNIIHQKKRELDQKRLTRVK